MAAPLELQPSPATPALGSALPAAGESPGCVSLCLWTRQALSPSCPCVNAGAGASHSGPQSEELLLSEDSGCRNHISLETLMDSEALPRTLSVGGGSLRGRGPGELLWYIHRLSFVRPCGVWVCSLPVAGLRVNAQCELDVSVTDTLIIPFAVLI